MRQDEAQELYDKEYETLKRDHRFLSNEEAGALAALKLSAALMISDKFLDEKEKGMVAMIAFNELLSALVRATEERVKAGKSIEDILS